MQIMMNSRIKKYLLALIHAAAEKFKMKIKNICILDTHFHMEIQPGEDENLSEIMKYIKQRFTQWINRTFDSEGSAWKDRFFSRIIEDLTDLVRVFVYIEENAVRAGLAKCAADYPFYQVWVYKNSAGGIFLDALQHARSQGWAAGAGLTYGYSWPISRRWNMEFTLGLGWWYTEYDRFESRTCGLFQERVARHAFGPTDLGLSFIYLIK